jgi:hypothetical protein
MPAGKSFYTFQTTAEWIATNVMLVGEMEMFNHEENSYQRIGNDYGNIEITSDNIDLVRQRPIDFSRAVDIAKYLLAHPFHNLPDLVLVVSAPWVDDPTAPQWVDGRATCDSASIETINAQMDKVLLKLGKLGQSDRLKLYALDGQHRLIGIRAAIQMLDHKRITRQKKDGSYATGRNSIESLEDWLDEVEELGITMNDANRFRTERVGIKLVPAVCAGETWEEAIQRLASIFKAFNTTSVAVTKGAAAAMDREDGFARAATKTYQRCEFLKDRKTTAGEEGRPPRLSPTNNTIAAKSTVLTTLATLKAMAYAYLHHADFADWYRPVKRNMMGQPPSADSVEKATDLLVELWDYIATLPSMRSIEPWKYLPKDVQDQTPYRAARNVAEMRRFPTTTASGEAHMLFRPLGQQALATALGVVVNDPHHPMSLRDIFEKLGRCDERNGFCMVDVKNPWWGVLYDQTKDKIVTNGTKLAADLLEYMLTGRSSRGDEDLRQAFATARKSSTPGKYVDLNGNEVNLDELALPPKLH